MVETEQGQMQELQRRRRLERRSERERLAREKAGGGPLIPVNPVHLAPPHSNSPLPPPVQRTRQHVSALPLTLPVPPLLLLPTPAFMRSRRRGETVSGELSAAGLTSLGRPMYRHEIAWLADGRGREMHKGAGGGAPGPAHPHAQMPNMMWEQPTQGDNNMVLVAPSFTILFFVFLAQHHTILVITIHRF
ncbi:hypothetical protein PAXINDRAFT_102228 [Paxillus involutus ATCC 200175]|uniref:Uncharacterized protein n=1 Tax=Paxillus involutus ATCC 200175 TaxID=664439 RepID=A0A0C9T1I3_PAXIN|nr:hypothetical protein PAXINDRAFT_102228 [Paxillus involutus ATCC 200175]